MGVANILSSLQDNPYFGAGFGLVGIGAGLALLRKANQFAMVAFRRNFMVTLEVSSRDKSYEWLLQWITRHASHTKHLSAETTYQQLENGSVKTRFDFVPSPGVHFFRYGRTWIKAERNRENKSMIIDKGSPWESVTLTALGTNRSIYFKILEEAREEALLQLEGMTITYTAVGPDWKQFGHPRKRRPLDSVILDQGVCEGVVADIRDFISSPEWYMNRGIPYRRGYLLYGPPGCGKSSFITALAGELEYSICVLNLSDRSLTDDRLNHLINVAPQQTIILLEDVDAAFISREDTPAIKTAYDGLNRVTFSGLLNTLDGVVSTEARILFMTTNYLERLDPALVRPGRVDLKVEIGHATNFQVEQLFQRFYPQLSLEKSRHFAKLVLDKGKKVSMAQIQGYFLLHKSDPEAVMKNIDNIWL